MQKPSMGRIVIVKGFNQSPDEQPALITHVLATQSTGPQHAHLVNVFVFADGGDIAFKGAIYLFDNRAAAEHYRNIDLSPVGSKPIVAFWPDKI